MKRLTDHEAGRFAARDAEGATSAELAAEFGLSPASMRRVRRRLGLPRRTGGQRGDMRPVGMSKLECPRSRCVGCNAPAVGRCVAGAVCGKCFETVRQQRAAVDRLLPRGAACH